jgi:hypothetical protein
MSQDTKAIPKPSEKKALSYDAIASNSFGVAAPSKQRNHRCIGMIQPGAEVIIRMLALCAANHN